MLKLVGQLFRKAEPEGGWLVSSGDLGFRSDDTHLHCASDDSDDAMSAHVQVTPVVHEGPRAPFVKLTLKILPG